MISLAALAAALAGACTAFAIPALAETLRDHRLAAAARPHRRRAAALMRLLARAGRPLRRGPAPDDLAALLDAAGASPRVSVSDLMAIKGGAALAAVAVALLAGPLAPGRLGLALLVAAPAAGFLAPDLALRRRARARTRTAELELADVAELLRVATDAGLAPGRAVAEVGRRHPGLVAAELRTAAARIALGVPQDEALAAFGRRVPTSGTNQLVAAFARAATHGAPLGPALSTIAADARAQQARAVRDQAARAAPKIQLVVALLLVPAVLLLVAASLAATLGAPS